MKKIPDALFVVDPGKEEIAVMEARKLHLPVVALSNSDSNIRLVNYPILGNDAGIPAITLITAAIAESYEAGKNSVVAPKEKEKDE